MMLQSSQKVGDRKIEMAKLLMGQAPYTQRFRIRVVLREGDG